MKSNRLFRRWIYGLATLLWLAPGWGRAADLAPADPASPKQAPQASSVEARHKRIHDMLERRAAGKDELADAYRQLKREWNDLSPKDRMTRLRELREQSAKPTFTREELEARRKELKNLSPEERRARIREWRESNSGPQRRLDAQLIELRHKKQEDTLTPEEAKRLERLEILSQRFESIKNPSSLPKKTKTPSQTPPKLRQNTD